MFGMRRGAARIAMAAASRRAYSSSKSSESIIRPLFQSVLASGTAVAVGLTYVNAFSLDWRAKKPLPVSKVGPNRDLDFQMSDVEVELKVRNIFTGGEVHEKDAGKPTKERMQGLVLRIQREICSALEELEAKAAKEDGDAAPKKFQQDLWEREEGGGGLTRVMQDGRVFEKAGVAVSAVHGRLTPAAVRMMNSRGKEIELEKDANGKPIGPKFFACGVSLVIHPHNPHAPTSHANYRYFEVTDEEGREKVWWFGGGSDLTPSYLYEEDAVHFHQTIADHVTKGDEKNAKTYYSTFKKWCDDYFRITHRGECRGVGGIFFDDLSKQVRDKDGNAVEEVKAEEETAEQLKERRFKFMQNVGESFVPSYAPIVDKRRNTPFTEKEKEWQALRRGRYAEFNLVYDRGTKFGLQSGGRVESIMMSLPLSARWEYCHKPEAGSAEDTLLAVLKNPREWIHV
mmetsp:Transcript_49725/g.127901  ORF Transcript_49725/g.127901 Transcript_49725/m.127901 type:complete len:456 (-) Transcript_49725:1558-2925(-)